MVHRALLIEDNLAARADLRDRLTAHPEVVIVGETDSVARARPLLARGDYDLVFLDIQLRGGDAFDLVPLVAPTARIIFVTAHDEYAVRAFEVNALDYLLKPVAPKRLAIALARTATSLPTDALATPFATALHPDDIVHLRTPSGSKLVALDDISVILAEQNYTQIWLREGKHELVRRPLKDWEQHLTATDFIRTSRDTLVNLRHVLRHERNGERGALLWVTGRDEPVSASFRTWPTVRARLAGRSSDMS